MSQIIRTTDGVDLYVEVKGQGIPCLYIHGGPGSGSYWMEKFSAGLLERHFQMIYLDQRGVARSTSPRDSNYCMERMVQDFEEVRAALGISKWLTIGHSFGGILQMGYALRCPQAVMGMLMLNCGLNMPESLRTSWMPKACEFLGITDTRPYTDETIPIFDRLQPLADGLREKNLFWKLAYASQENEAIMNTTFGEVPGWNHDFESAFANCPEYLADYSPATRDLKMPVLFFYGKTDWMVGPQHYRCAAFPEMLLWPSDVGHVAIMENRADLEKAITSYMGKYW